MIVMMPAGGCGTLPLGTQMMMLAAALLNTMVRIMDTVTGMVPMVYAAICALGMGVYKIVKWLKKRSEEEALKKQQQAMAMMDDATDGGFSRMTDTINDSIGDFADSVTDSVGDAVGRASPPPEKKETGGTISM